ncbi:SDR family oxidoreductase [Armatimonas sp.]|uniref:SDR family NAD(P)-dependent oxidoreductase n=1 Tax=Armatimonas sp. TaxID=1872638 RepID=UPI00286AF83F|nr:SDR family oxidoreductase [Armatimonas sp.]
MLLSGKVVLVTGGGRGIGAAICRVLAREGAHVAVNYGKSAEKAEAVAAEIGNGAKAYQADVIDEASVAAMIAAIVSDFGRIDGVINNAIAGAQPGKLGEHGWAGYQNMLDYNVKAVYNTLTAARPHFQAQGGGRVVNIVTELWNMAPAGWSMYTAGKGAMVGMSRSLATELGPENITVNMVAPGWMADEKVDTESEGSKNFAKSIPLRVHGSAEEIGNGCVFFLSHLANYVTGVYLPVTGGRITQTGM